MGRFCKIEGRWFDDRLMYSGASLGFRRRWYFSLRRSSVKSRKSRKLVIVKFVLIVTRNPRCLSRFVKSILMRSASLSDVLLKTARPSSWPRPGFHWQLGEGKQSYKFTSFCAVFAPHCNVKHSVAILLRPDFVITKKEGLSRVVDDTNFMVGDFNVLSGEI